MALELDARQRAMLQQMGVRVWLPDAAAPAPADAPAPKTAAPPAAPPAPRDEGTRLPGPAHVPAPAVAPTQGVRHVEPNAAPLVRSEAAPAPRAALAPGDWTALETAVRDCQACGLCSARRQVTLQAPVAAQACDWMVVGDPPDAEEEAAGAPFAGADGVLLANMLRALGLQRANPVAGAAAPDAALPPARRAYVTNVLKCRAAPGAPVQAGELAQCAQHLQQEIALVRPRVILALGRFAMQLLLGETPQSAGLPLGKLRGAVYRSQGTAVVVSYPPKMLMRNGGDKAKAWADWCQAAELLES